MTIRAAALFIHLVGMLVLFVGFAIEWISLESLRRSRAQPATLSIGLLRALPRFSGLALGLILASGIYLASTVGVLQLSWVRASFSGMVLAGVLGGTALRPLARKINQPRASEAGGSSDLRQLASQPFLGVSLRARIAISLAIVYLMVAKPNGFESFALIGAALVIGVVTGLPTWSARPAEQP